MAASDYSMKNQKLLIANRGEIAYRILKTAKRALSLTSPHIGWY